MTQKIIYAIYPESECAVQKFMERLVLSGVQTKRIKSSEKYDYFESTWNDSEIPELLLKNPRKAGAKLKQLEYKGKPVPCGSIWLLKYQKKLSNKEIGEFLNVSESTINRRIKKHLENGSFHENSKVIF